MRDKNGFKPTKKQNLTRNHLVNNDSQEMLCQDNAIISKRIRNQTDNRGRFRYARGEGNKIKRMTMSEHSFRSNDRGEKVKSSMALWCCLQSKSRAASVESNGAVKDNNSENSGCSVF
jgi:hypothetical protein